MTSRRVHLPEADEGDDVKVEVRPCLLPGELFCGFAEIAQRPGVVDEDGFCDHILINQKSETNKHKTWHE